MCHVMFTLNASKMTFTPGHGGGGGGVITVQVGPVVISKETWRYFQLFLLQVICRLPAVFAGTKTGYFQQERPCSSMIVVTKPGILSQTIMLS